jgi:hypothetical protein
MQTMTYDEMRKLNGGKYACAISTIGWAAAEYGMIAGFASGGIGFGIAVVGMAAGLYGMMASC